MPFGSWGEAVDSLRPPAPFLPLSQSSSHYDDDHIDDDDGQSLHGVITLDLLDLEPERFFFSPVSGSRQVM